MCQRCQVPLKVESKWLLELPLIYTVGFQYANLDCQLPTSDLKHLYNLITPRIELNQIMQISDPPKGVSSQYVLRGMI